MSFFGSDDYEIVETPNELYWWHSAPLPDKKRIRGAHPDIDRQFKVWQAMQLDGVSLAGKSVLDIGANDGFFSVAAACSGADVTSIDSSWMTWPHNIRHLSRSWSVSPDIVTNDFRAHDFGRKFDVIFFLGVIYHVEDVFSCMQKLSDLLVDRGTIYMETHLTDIASDRPIWEAASDIYPTSAPQGKQGFGLVGISNFLLPNTPAIINLAHTFDLACEPLLDNDYCREDPTRGIFKITKA